MTSPSFCSSEEWPSRRLAHADAAAQPDLFVMNGLPDPIATAVSFQTATVRVTHHPPTALGTAGGSIVLREQHVTPDTLTRIEVWPHGRPQQSVSLLWERKPGTEGVGIFFSDIADTLFIGAGTFAAAVRLATGQVVGSHEVFLFWSFQPSGEFVLELGEAACFLRSATGEILAETAVDPPYELFETPQGVRFESVHTEPTWLRFPGR
jgi:hypothetical protein